MRQVANWLATVAGIGYLPGAPGTFGSLAGWGLGLLLSPSIKAVPSVRLGAWLVIVFLLGAVAAEITERYSQTHDPSWIVIDELWGMAALVLLFPPAQRLPGGLIAFVLFRFFDILKPFPLKHLARLPGGWGIMADDLGASGYALVLLWLGVAFFS
ncbi:MAG: phosphatidylglycerophosphatase A [Candidatus Omnitrophica bacterium]|nr:phosphatidylglycerophosphatase A [Candidatus Omnitrophota bacterium]